MTESLLEKVVRLAASGAPLVFSEGWTDEDRLHSREARKLKEAETPQSRARANAKVAASVYVGDIHGDEEAATEAAYLHKVMGKDIQPGMSLLGRDERGKVAMHEVTSVRPGSRSATGGKQSIVSFRNHTKVQPTAVSHGERVYSSERPSPPGVEPEYGAMLNALRGNG